MLLRVVLFFLSVCFIAAAYANTNPWLLIYGWALMFAAFLIGNK